MKETFQGTRGRVLTVPPELEEAWAKASPRPSRSQREIDVLRYWLDRTASETIQLHILLTACVKALAPEPGGSVSFSIAELTELQDIKKLVAVSSSDSIGEVRVKLPDTQPELIVKPGALLTQQAPHAAPRRRR